MKLLNFVLLSYVRLKDGAHESYQVIFNQFLCLNYFTVIYYTNQLSKRNFSKNLFKYFNMSAKLAHSGPCGKCRLFGLKDVCFYELVIYNFGAKPKKRAY